MDLSTQYLGLALKSPFVPSSSPLSKRLDPARQLEDAGAAAIVMYSLFEEAIEADERLAAQLALQQDIGSAEASSYLPMHQEFPSQRDEYLEQLRRLKAALDIPVIASLNGTTRGGWVRHARAIEAAGADALELNIYYIAADFTEPPAAVEQRVIDILTETVAQVSLPIGVKLSPYYSALGHLVTRIEAAGAAGVALFNRFYQPDIDTGNLDVSQVMHLSGSKDALLAMRWMALLRGRVNLSLAATGGVHTAEDALKMLLCGADVTYLCSTLLLNGPGQLSRIHDGVVDWMERHEYASVGDLRGSLSQQHSPDPAAFERGNYLQMLSNYEPPKSVWR
ncbi:MAG: dihydroorotate dehydrogenase-like protein [Gammaproteobacteria bacterium]|nr:dihydroorotate dehydrogenase-like protein [Gammaproteobacteria bacterium]